MALKYAASRYATTFAGTTKNEFVENARTHLNTAGYSDVAGGSSGDRTLEAGGGEYRARLFDTATNCASAGIRKTDDTNVLETNALRWLPQAGNWRLIATPNSFFIYDPASYLTARKFGCVIQPFRESYLSGLSVCVHMHCNANGDTDTTLRASFRTGLTTHVTPGGAARGTIINSDSVQTNTASQSSGDTAILQFRPSTNNSDMNGIRQFYDTSYFFYDPLIVLSANLSVVSKVCGQLEDALISTYSFANGDTFSYDGYDWEALTPAVATDVHTLCLVYQETPP